MGINLILLTQITVFDNTNSTQKRISHYISSLSDIYSDGKTPNCFLKERVK